MIEKIKQFLKENYKYLLTLLVAYFILSYPMPYYIYVGGGTIDINDRIKIEDTKKKETKGSLNFAYVQELKGTLSNFLLAHIIPDWDMDKEEDYKLSEDETMDDIEFRNQIYLQSANQTATFLAYQKAKKELNVKKRHYYVLYVDKSHGNELKVGDEILKVEKEELKTVEDYSRIVDQKEIGDTINLTVKRKNKEKEVTAKVYEDEEKKLTGTTISVIYEYETNPKLTLTFKKSESGPSGGLMLTLAIYNKLVEEDITHGLNIVGTGTIESDGTVGEIGGIKYKLKGAVKKKADLFLAPAGTNYQEAIKEKKKHKYKITIKEVKTFDDALKILKKIEKEKEK